MTVSKGKQRITASPSEFTSGSGVLDVKGKVRQVGSLIDGDFTLNSEGYEKEDLEDINKSRTVGLSVTVYSNTTYSQRDRNGNQIYVNGSNPKGTGAAVKTGVSYGETDKTREILATVGAGVKTNQDLTGVNRSKENQVGDFEGTEIRPINIDLMTEYWATEAGRGKLRDLIENSERTTEGIKRILTTRDENGNLNVLKNVEAESLVQKFTRIGYVDTKGKTQQQVKQELEARFGSLAKKGVKVYFYGEKDVDTSNLDNATKTKLLANGFAITEDGTVWINKEHVDSGKVIDFNTLTQHEISHILFGKDSEYQAQYVEAAYREFLTGLAKNGYAQNGSGITDYDASMLTVQEIARLNGYTDEEMQEFFNQFMEGLIGKKNWRNLKNSVQANVKRVPIVGAATSKILTKVSQIDRKIAPKAGMKAGRATGNGVKTAVKVVKKTGDKIAEVKKNIEKAQKERAERKRIASQKKAKEKEEKKKAELKERQEIAKRLTSEEKALGEMLGRATYINDHYYYTSYYGGERKTGKDYEHSDMFQQKKENLAIDLAKENIKFGGKYRIYDGAKYVTSVKTFDDLIKISKVMSNNNISIAMGEVYTYAKLQEKGPYPVNIDLKGAMITAGSVNSVANAVMMRGQLNNMSKLPDYRHIDEPAYLQDKMKYLFGEATGSKHNIERSLSTASELSKIGINNTITGREAVKEHLIKTYNNPDSIISTSSWYNKHNGITYYKTIRESFLKGPTNGVKTTSVWWGNELKTVVIEGAKK